MRNENVSASGSLLCPGSLHKIGSNCISDWALMSSERGQSLNIGLKLLRVRKLIACLMACMKSLTSLGAEYICGRDLGASIVMMINCVTMIS